MRRHVLRWLDVSHRIKFRLCFTVYNCVHGITPDYLSELYRQVSALQVRRHLRSAGRDHLDFPRGRCTTYGKRSPVYAGPSAWNSLPDDFRNTFLSVFSVFQSKLKKFSPVC